MWLIFRFYQKYFRKNTKICEYLFSIENIKHEVLSIIGDHIGHGYGICLILSNYYIFLNFKYSFNLL